MLQDKERLGEPGRGYGSRWAVPTRARALGTRPWSWGCCGGVAAGVRHFLLPQSAAVHLVERSRVWGGR